MEHPHFTKILSFTLSLLTISKSCIAADTLSPNQPLSDGEVLTSPNRRFELGFFSPVNNTARFLGIWYKATPDVVVWVANRETPIIGPHSFLTLTSNGSLILTSSQSKTKTIWINPSPIPSSTPSLHLLDSGNLVIADKLNTALWQSFDYPCDTRLPGMKMVADPETGEAKYLTSWKTGNDPSAGEFSYMIENHGLSQLVITKNGKERIYRTIFWGGHFAGFPNSQQQGWKTEFTSHQGRLVALFNPLSEAVITRITMNSSGMLEAYVMNDRRDGWNLMIASPGDAFDSYGRCGHNSICKIGQIPICECLRGFRPRSEKEWNIYEWGRGCYRSDPALDCGKGDEFLKMEGVKFPDSVVFQVSGGVSSVECRGRCLRDCNCTAFADPYSDGGSNCLMWFGDLIDVRELSEEAGAQPTLYVRVPVSELVSDGKRKGAARGKMKAIAVAASVFGIVILGLAFGGFLLRMRRRRQACKKVREEFELPLLDLATIAVATNNFSAENLIGEGGFGPVYKGNLPTGEAFAVKRMLRTSRQGHEEFENEVILIAKLQHRNLVRILGCCTEGEENMLIYEYMQNKSLDYFIFDQSRSALLTWPMRFTIIMGVAKGLLYLHHDSRLKIIHRDLKTNENLNAKISDFGLARMFEGDQTTARTERVIGTYGYMAPEYAYNGKFSIKSDIFSFGVVMLEIVSGKRNKGFKHPSCYQHLLEQAWLLWKESRELELMDPSYDSSYVESQVERCIQVGLLCVQNEADDRPEMSSVFLMLSTEDVVMPQPKEPGFLSSSFSHSNNSRSKRSSIGEMTMSDIEAR